MFAGHYAAALAAKRVAPSASLGTLAAAALWLDLVWPAFLLAGLETVSIRPGVTVVTPLDFEHYPYSHSLAAAAAWSAAFAAAVLARGRSARAAGVCGLLVASHWFLDAAVHRPDLPLYPGGPKVGLGLWDSLPATLAVEAGLFAVGLALYVGATRPRDAKGRWGPWLFGGLLAAVYAGAVFGPPPPSVDALAWSACGQLLFVALAAWVDRHRAPAR